VRRLLRLLIIALVAMVVLVAAGGVYARSQMRASLPRMNGEAAIAGLESPVRVDRDALGVPTIVGESREDVARALGFVHAQDRFFQMDLQRRQPAGELSALVGRAPLPWTSSPASIAFAMSPIAPSSAPRRRTAVCSRRMPKA